jgi:hypothetical protein
MIVETKIAARYALEQGVLLCLSQPCCRVFVALLRSFHVQAAMIPAVRRFLQVKPSRRAAQVLVNRLLYRVLRRLIGRIAVPVASLQCSPHPSISRHIRLNTSIH